MSVSITYLRRCARLLCPLLWCLLTLVPVAAQTEYEPDNYTDTQLPEAERRNYSTADWKELTADLDYSEEAAPPKKEEKKETTRTEAPPERRRTGGGGSAQVLKLLGIILGLAGLVYLIFRLFGGDQQLFSSDRKLKGEEVRIDIESIEERLEETELAGPIQQAVQQEDYALAIRLHYLDILKALSARGALRWKRDKTNGQYLRELAGHPLREDFRQLTRAYERVWYGEAALTESVFQQLLPRFKSLAHRAAASAPAA